MNNYQVIIVGIYGIIAGILFLKSFRECNNNNNAFGENKLLNVIGGFVWADGVVFGLFFSLFSLASLILKDFLLFLLGLSLFWVVRSAGEAIYWFNQQFSAINRNPPEKFCIYNIFKNDSVWFVMQIAWQCALVVFLLLSLYLGARWLHTVIK